MRSGNHRVTPAVGVQSLKKEVTRHKARMEVLIKEEWATQSDEWKQRRVAAMEGSSGTAHRFAKVRGLQKYKLAKGADGVVSCSAADQLTKKSTSGRNCGLFWAKTMYEKGRMNGLHQTGQW